MRPQRQFQESEPIIQDADPSEQNYYLEDGAEVHEVEMEPDPSISMVIAAVDAANDVHLNASTSIHHFFSSLVQNSQTRTSRDYNLA